jgi:iron complex outermembrane recepter protein
MIRSFFTLLLLSLLSFVSQAQPPSPGKVSGIVVDAGNKTPLEYATIVLRNLKDSTTTGTLTDEKGRFTVEPVKFGMYQVEVTYLGYDAFTLPNVKVIPPEQIVALGEIKLSESASELQTVVVTGEKAMMQLGAEKKVFNVDKNAIVTGGNGMDVLKQIPTVDVTIDGNISMRGTENVLILINGKPSGLTGNSKQAILESLPAGSIESVEIINNPSAKYDADGTAGIINIVLKKNYNRGLNGNINAGYSTIYKNNAGLSLNFKKNRINFTSNYNYRYWESFYKGNNLRKNISNDFTNFINAYDYTRTFNTSGNVNLNMDIEINPKSTLSFTNITSYSKGKNRSDNDVEFLDVAEVYYAGFDRDADSRRENISNDATVSYRRTYASPGRTLDILVNHNYSFRDNPQFFTQTDFDADGNNLFPIDLREFTNNQTTSHIAIGQMDYVHPFEKHGKLEAGLKTTIRDLFSDFMADSLNRTTGQTDVNFTLSNAYRYFENVNAAYASFGGTVKKFSYKAGLRVEQSNISIDNSQVENKQENHYTDFFPSVFMSQKLPKNHEVQLSYSRRINRPTPWMLNPFADYSNPLNIFAGNASLSPEYINALEFTYVKNWNSIFLTSTTYYRHISDNFSRVRIVDSATSVSTVTWANLESSQNIGEEIIFRAPITKWWNVLANVNLFQNIIKGDVPGGDNDLSTNNFMWNFRIQTGFKFWKNTDLQLSYRYNSRINYLQGFIKPIHHMDVGIKKDIMKNKASIALNVQDVFNTRRFFVESNGSNFESTSDRRWETRILTANFTWKFGKGETNNNPKRRPNQNMDDGGGNMMF